MYEFHGGEMTDDAETEQARGRGLCQLPFANEVSDGQKNEVFSLGLSREHKGSCVHPGRLH